MENPAFGGGFLFCIACASCRPQGARVISCRPQWGEGNSKNAKGVCGHSLKYAGVLAGGLPKWKISPNACSPACPLNGGGGIIRKGGMVEAIFWGMPRGWIDSLPDILKSGKRLLCNLLGRASVLRFGNFSGAFQPMSAPRFFLNGMIVFRSGFVRRNLKCRAGFACVLMPRKESSALIGIGGDGFYCEICIIKRCPPCPPRETPSAFSFFFG